MVEVVFSRGKQSIKYKNDFDEKEYKEINFLNSKITKNAIFPKPKSQVTYKGISTEKKKNIIKNLGGLIGKSRMKFWENLPVSN